PSPWTVTRTSSATAASAASTSALVKPLRKSSTGSVLVVLTWGLLIRESVLLRNDMSGGLRRSGDQCLDDGVGDGLGRARVLSRDEVAVDHDVTRPGGGAVVEHRTGVLQRGVD